MSKKSVPKTITLDSNLVSEVEQRAIKENRNFSNMVETLLINATKRKTD